LVFFCISTFSSATFSHIIEICFIYQDDELGGNETIPTKEVIQILVNSYKSSEMNQDVEKEVAELTGKVSLIIAK